MVGRASNNAAVASRLLPVNLGSWLWPKVKQRDHKPSRNEPSRKKPGPHGSKPDPHRPAVGAWSPADAEMHALTLGTVRP